MFVCLSIWFNDAKPDVTSRPDDVTIGGDFIPPLCDEPSLDVVAPKLWMGEIDGVWRAVVIEIRRSGEMAEDG